MKNKNLTFFIKFIIILAIGKAIYHIVSYTFSYFSNIQDVWINKFSYFIFLLFLIFAFFSFIKHIFLVYGISIIKYLSNFFNRIIDYFLTKKSVENFIRNNPKTVTFIKNRFKKDEFSGIPLTILSLLIFYTIFVFLGFIEAFLTSDIIKGLDYRLAAFFYAFRNDFLVNVFLWITYLGRFYTLVGFTLIICIYLLIKNYKNEVVGFLIGIIGSSLFGSVLKIMFQHPRPEYEIYKESGYSFPSLHAIMSISFYGYIIWLFIRNSKKWKMKINYFFSFFILAFLIGFSRLYLGVHYLSDVLGGYLIGCLWLFFTIGLTEFLNIKCVRNIKAKTIKDYSIKYGLFSIGFLFFIVFNSLFPYKLNKYPVELSEEKSIVSANDIFPTSYLKYSQTFLGGKAENINFVFFSDNDEKINEIFKEAGWFDSDKLSYESMKQIGNNLLYQKPYNTAPITPLFWDNKTQDFSFQKLPDSKDISFRHHIRIWKTNLKFNNYYIYVGVGVFDDGLKRDITHKIHPDIDKEREYIFNDLINTGKVENYKKINLVEPYNGKNIFGDHFFTDGKCYFLVVK